MALLSTSTHRLMVLLIFIQSVSLYKTYPLEDTDSTWFSDLSFPSFNRPAPTDNFDSESENGDLRREWASLLGESNENPENSFHKRAFLSSGSPSANRVQQRRNNRPHWNPLVAAYRRCGELSRREERESCFKDAIQMLFVHKLRK